MLQFEVADMNHADLISVDGRTPPVTTQDGPEDEIMTLRASGPDAPNSLRITIISDLRKGTEAKINHFDTLRQRNLVMAIAIFAGIFGFSARPDALVLPWLGAASLTALMLLFGRRDVKQQRNSRGWQATRRGLTRALVRAYNHPDQEVSFPRYSMSGEKEKRGKRFHALVFTILAAGGPLGIAAVKLIPLLFK